MSESTPADTDMSRQFFSVADSGRARTDDHSIDVETLTPALMGIGRLIRLANSEFNGDKSYARGMIISDFEHRCFNIHFETIVGILGNIKAMFGMMSDDIKGAKDILTQLGIIGGGGSAAGGLTFYGYLRYRKGRKIDTASIVEQGKDGKVSVKFEGDNNPIVINQHIYNLSHNASALRSVRDTFAPLGVDGFDTIKVTSDVSEGVSEGSIIDPQEAEDILASCVSALEDANSIEPDVQQTTAWLSIYSPVFDVKANMWRFRMNRHTIYADISETKIAEDALAREGAMVDDAYEVRLEM